MPHAAFVATACVLNGRLYVMGGINSNRLQVLEMTEENGLAWTVKAELPDRRYGAVSAVHQGKIWVIGGTVDGQPSTSVITYDADADTWATGPSLPSPCVHGSVTSIDGGIFLHGAANGHGGGTRAFEYVTEARHGPRWERADAGGTEGLVHTVCGSVLLG